MLPWSQCMRVQCKYYSDLTLRARRFVAKAWSKCSNSRRRYGQSSLRIDLGSSKISKFSGGSPDFRSSLRGSNVVRPCCTLALVALWLRHWWKSELIVKFDRQIMLKTNNMVIPLPFHHALISLTSTGVRRTEANTNRLSTKMTAYKQQHWVLVCKHHIFCLHMGRYGRQILNEPSALLQSKI